MCKRILACFIAIVLVLSLATVALAAKAITPKVLEAVFIHYEHPGKGKPSPPSEEPKVYDFYLLLGLEWDLGKYPAGVPYVINPSGAPSAASAELFNDNPIVDTNSWWGKLDGKNNVSWQVISGGGIIAGTWVWYQDNDNSGTMSPGDEILETDIVLNASQRWGIDLDGEGTGYKLRNAYDVRNIATHEVGHVVGLDDLYEEKYSEITMWGYSSKGETKKISLEVGDVNGTRELYGP